MANRAAPLPKTHVGSLPFLNSLALDAFLACARSGQATLAAKALHITQSALSQRIRNLEDNLQVTLFLRSRSGMALTDAGRELVRHCVVHEAMETEVVQRLRGTSEGLARQRVGVASFSSVHASIVAVAAAAASRKFPSLVFDLRVDEMAVLPRLLENGSVQFCLLDAPLTAGPFEARVIGVERNVLVERACGPVADVFLDHNQTDAYTKTYFGARAGAGLTRHFVGDIHAILAGVKHGLGRAILPRHLVRGHDDLRILNPSKELRVPVVLHFAKQSYMPESLRGVMQALVETAKETL
ncbi:MAG: LysR family transcriptional regulator [Silvanigrellales bacterium]|jgi:DNA-binding transcriptional LysR family regulator|nr:LysR family transcriptional regulator [Silvanigrellales bacterium]